MSSPDKDNSATKKRKRDESDAGQQGKLGVQVKVFPVNRFDFQQVTRSQGNGGQMSVRGVATGRGYGVSEVLFFFAFQWVWRQWPLVTALWFVCAIWVTAALKAATHKGLFAVVGNGLLSSAMLAPLAFLTVETGRAS